MYSIPDFASNAGAPPGSTQFDLGSLGGASSTSNQWGSFPSMTSSPSTGGSLDMTTTSTPQTPPGIVPPSGGAPPMPAPGTPNPGASVNTPGGRHNLGSGFSTSPTIDPQFTSQFMAWLQSQLGQGAAPFDLSAIMPSSGQVTAPGTLTAPENALMQSLNQFYTTGTGGPLPGVLPMWTSEMKSMQIPIEQQMANIKEQFGARGALGSSEMASAMGTFGEQTALQQESLLGELTLQALPGMQSEAAATQQLDQSSIDNLLKEFIRTSPDYSPLLGMEMGAATTFPPIFGGSPGFGSQLEAALAGSLGKGLGGLITG